MASNKWENEEIKVLHLRIFSIIRTMEKLKPPLKNSYAIKQFQVIQLSS